MNLLIISDFQIYPVNGGASIAQLGAIQPLSHKCNVSLVLSEHYTPTEKELDELKALLPNVKVYTLKESVSASKSIRFLHLVISFVNLLKRSVKKKLLKTGTQASRGTDDDLGALHTYLYPVRSKKDIDCIAQIIKDDAIDIVQLEFDSNLNLVSFLPDHVKKVFVIHECQFYRINSHTKAKAIQTDFSNYIYNVNRTIELAFLEQFDTLISFNEDEAGVLNNALQERGSAAKAVVSPFPILDKYFTPLDRETFSQPDKLTFIGGEIHFPNKDAIEWFLDETALYIFKEFKLRLHVIGNWSKETIEKYSNHPSEVKFIGYVDDLYQFTKNSISIAPIRIGGGLRSKIILSMAQGIPVISTTHALLGINAKHLKSVMIADDKVSFCEAVRHLISDLDFTFSLCKNAQKLMREEYSQSVTSEKRYSLYKDLLMGKFVDPKKTQRQEGRKNDYFDGGQG